MKSDITVRGGENMSMRSSSSSSETPVLPPAPLRGPPPVTPTAHIAGGGTSSAHLGRSTIGIVAPQEPVQPAFANFDDFLRGMDLLGLKEYDVPPPILPQFRSQMVPVGGLIFSSRPLATALYDTDSFVEEAVRGNPHDYLAVGIDGYGLNSKSYCYYLVSSPLALFIKAPFEPVLGPFGEMVEEAERHMATRSLIGALSNMTEIITRTVTLAVAEGKWPPNKKLVLVADYFGHARAGWLEADGRIDWAQMDAKDVLIYAQQSLARLRGVEA